MTVTAKVLAEGQVLPGTDTVVYTAPLLTTTIIDKVTTANYDTVPRVATFSIVPSGGTLADAYFIAKHTLQSKETYIWPEMVGQILAPGDYVSAIASNATGVNVRMSGREIT